MNFHIHKNHEMNLFLLVVSVVLCNAAIVPVFLSCKDTWSMSQSVLCSIPGKDPITLLPPLSVLNGSFDTSLELGFAFSSYDGATIDNVTHEVFAAPSGSQTQVCFGGHTARRQLFVSCVQFSLSSVTFGASLRTTLRWLSNTDQWNGALGFAQGNRLHVQNDVLCIGVPSNTIANELSAGIYCQSLRVDNAVSVRVSRRSNEPYSWLSTGDKMLCVMTSSSLNCGSPRVNFDFRFVAFNLNVLDGSVVVLFLLHDLILGVLLNTRWTLRMIRCWMRISVI